MLAWGPAPLHFGPGRRGRATSNPHRTQVAGWCAGTQPDCLNSFANITDNGSPYPLSKDPAAGEAECGISVPGKCTKSNAKGRWYTLSCDEAAAPLPGLPAIDVNNGTFGGTIEYYKDSTCSTLMNEQQWGGVCTSDARPGVASWFGFISCAMQSGTQYAGSCRADSRLDCLGSVAKASNDGAPWPLDQNPAVGNAQCISTAVGQCSYGGGLYFKIKCGR